MWAFRRHLRSFVWAALLAMAVLALWPSVARATASPQALGSWAEICTAQGATRVSLGEDGNGGSSAPLLQQLMQQMTHCPMCLLSAAPLAPPPTAVAGLALPLGRQTPPAARALASRSATSWPSAQPRGPPLFF